MLRPAPCTSRRFRMFSGEPASTPVASRPSRKRPLHHAVVALVRHHLLNSRPVRQHRHARCLRQTGQERRVVLARVPTHDAPHCRVRLQRRRVDAQRLPRNQLRLRQLLQHPPEDRLMRLDRQQTSRARDCRMVQRRRRRRQAQEHPHAQRIGRAPRDACQRRTGEPSCRSRNARMADFHHGPLVYHARVQHNVLAWLISSVRGTFVPGISGLSSQIGARSGSAPNRDALLDAIPLIGHMRPSPSVM